MKTKFTHIHLAITGELAEKLDFLASEWKLKRPHVLAKLVDREYKMMLRKRAAVASVEPVEVPHAESN